MSSSAHSITSSTHGSRLQRGVQGNCSNPDPASVLGLSVEDAAGLLPLKPFQCLLITHESVLSVNAGNVWVDNLYLRAARGPLVDSDVLAFLFTPNGLIFNTRPAWDGPQDGDVRLYVTDTVFQAARRSAAGVLAGSDSGYRQGLGVFSTSVLIDGVPHRTSTLSACTYPVTVRVRLTPVNARAVRTE